MSYTLAGLAHISPDAATSSFLIPFFRAAHSNHFFAQDLDAAHRIVAFVLFDPSTYRTTHDHVPALEKQVGDVGVMAYARRDHPARACDANEIIADLAKANLVGDAAPFFEIDAYRLTGQTEKLGGAMKRARKALGGGAMAKAWARRERLASTRVSSAQVLDFDQMVLDLEQQREPDESWVRRWLELWNRNLERGRVARLGTTFVLKTSGRTLEKGKVLGALASFLPTLQSPKYATAAIAWLRQCQRIGQFPPEWARIWLTCDHDDIVSLRDLREDAISYLRAAPKGRPRQWPMIWARLYNMAQRSSSDDVEQVLTVASTALKGAKPTSNLARMIVSLLVEIDDHHTQAILRRWVATPLHATAWIDAYLAALRAAPNDPEILKMGLAWLETDPGGLRRWVSVFEAVEAITGQTMELDDIARDWLLRANKQMNSWPEVATKYLARRYDPHVAEMARDWSYEHAGHAAAWNLNLALAAHDDTAPRTVSS